MDLLLKDRKHLAQDPMASQFPKAPEGCLGQVGSDCSCLACATAGAPGKTAHLGHVPLRLWTHWERCEGHPASREERSKPQAVRGSSSLTQDVTFPGRDGNTAQVVSGSSSLSQDIAFPTQFAVILRITRKKRRRGESGSVRLSGDCLAEAMSLRQRPL